MEREGRGEVGREGRGRRGGVGRRRGRRGRGEMRKGIIVGGMILSLLLGCNNGGEDPQKVFLKSVVSLGNEFLNVFTSFGDVFNSSLGFKKDLKKSDVIEYFKNVREKVEDIRTALNKIVTNMKNENNPNASDVKTKVDDLIKNKLNNIIDGAETASGAIGEASESLGNVSSQATAGAKAEENSVRSLSEGIGKIVSVVVLKDKGNPTAGTDKKAEDGTQRNNSTGAAKLFSNNVSGIVADSKKSGTDAAKAVGGVTGADILRAIIKDDSDAVKLAVNDATNAEAANQAKDATIAGAIALKAMAKNGKFPGGEALGHADYSAEIKGAAVSAVTKALDILTIAIRRTIDEGLKEVKEAMKINANDNPVTSETATASK